MNKLWYLIGMPFLIMVLLIFSVMAVPKMRVAIIPPGTTSPFHSEVAKGAQEKGEEIGFRVEVRATEKETDFNGQVEIMRSFIAKKMDAISVNAINDIAISTAIAEAVKAKIPVFIHNSLTPIPGEKVVEYIGYNQRKGGMACGEYAVKLLKGSGKLYILEGIPGFHQVERTGGFMDAIRNCPGIIVMGKDTADWERDKATALTLQALRKYPGIKLVFADSDEMAIGAAIAAHTLGKNIYTIGIDGNPVTLDKISEGIVTATLGVYPDKMGEQIILQMARYLKGQKIPTFFETSAVVVDKNNLEDYKAGKLWVEPKEGTAEVLPNQ